MRVILGLIFTYVLVFALSLFVKMDSPAHWVLPAVGFLLVYLMNEMIDREIKDFTKSYYFLLFLLVLFGAAYYIGIYAFTYTYVLFGSKWYDINAMNALLAYIPYWTMVPGIIMAWAVRKYVKEFSLQLPRVKTS